MKPNYSRTLLYVSVACFLVCLWADPSDPVGGGLGALLFGFMEIFELKEVGPFVAFAWLANPLLFVTWGLATQARTVAVVAGVAACLLCLGYIAFGRVVGTDESGSPHALVRFTRDYGFWLFSILLALLRAVIQPKASESAEKKAL